jgi:hypothetical protein
LSYGGSQCGQDHLTATVRVSGRETAPSSRWVACHLGTEIDSVPENTDAEMRIALSLQLVLCGRLPLAPSLRAQVVTGTVTSSGSAREVQGALITLLRESDSRSEARTLSDERGHYALRAPGPGHYRVSVKRIGIVPARTAAFQLEADESRVVDLTAEGVAVPLPAVRVAVRVVVCALCSSTLRRSVYALGRTSRSLPHGSSSWAPTEWSRSPLRCVRSRVPTEPMSRVSYGEATG